MTEHLLWVLVGVHLLVCLAVLALMRADVLKARPTSLPVVVAVPVFGLVALVVYEMRLRDKDAVCEQFELEELRVNDAIHRSILMEQSTVGEQVVPLQEALLLNDAAMRRELIMDVLYEGAESQPHVLRAARSNDDVEVVHYATTALVELQKTYDERIAAARAAYEADPDDAALAAEFAQVVGDYIDSGLLEGTMLVSVRAEYARVLDALVSLLPAGSRAALDANIKAFENALARGDGDTMDRCARQVVEGWPNREEGYLMRLHIAVGAGDRAGVDAALDELCSGEVRLSAHGRHEVAFWREGGADA